MKRIGSVNLLVIVVIIASIVLCFNIIILEQSSAMEEIKTESLQKQIILNISSIVYKNEYVNKAEEISLEQLYVTVARTVSILMILVIALAICILIAKKNNLFHFKQKEEDNIKINA